MFRFGYFQVVLFFFLIVGGCASVGAKVQATETLKPSGIREDCLELLPGQGLNYSFEASAPLNFNIHYHENEKVSYEVSKDAVSKDAGIFLAKKEQYYCLMWTNPGSEPVTLRYERNIIEGQK